MGQNARKGKFSCDFIEITQFDEAAFMVGEGGGGVKVAEFESVLIIEMGPFLVFWAPFLHNCRFYQIEWIL